MPSEFGPAITSAAYAVARGSAQELLATGTYTTLAGGLDFGYVNELLSKPSSH